MQNSYVVRKYLNSVVNDTPFKDKGGHI